MKKYMKVGLMTVVLCGLVARGIQAAPDTMLLSGSVAAIHNLTLANTGASPATDLGLTSYTGTNAKVMGTFTVNDNNPTGFACRFYSQNYANGFIDNTNAGAVLLLASSSSVYPGAGVVTANSVTGASPSYPGIFVPYKIDFKETSVTQRGALLANITIAGTALGSGFNVVPTIIKNATDATNEIKFNTPSQATMGHVFTIGLSTTAKSTLFAGTYKDTLEMAILDFDSNSADVNTLYGNTDATSGTFFVGSQL